MSVYDRLSYAQAKRFYSLMSTLKYLGIIRRFNTTINTVHSDDWVAAHNLSGSRFRITKNQRPFERVP